MLSIKIKIMHKNGAKVYMFFRLNIMGPCILRRVKISQQYQKCNSQPCCEHLAIRDFGSHCMYWLFGQGLFSALRCTRPFGTTQVSTPDHASNPRHKRRDSVIAVRIPTDTIAYNIVKDVRNMRVLSNIQLEYITNEFSREQILSLLLVYNHVIENVNTYMETH